MDEQNGLLLSCEKAGRPDATRTDLEDVALGELSQSRRTQTAGFCSCGVSEPRARGQIVGWRPPEAAGGGSWGSPFNTWTFSFARWKSSRDGRSHNDVDVLNATKLSF